MSWDFGHDQWKFGITIGLTTKYHAYKRKKMSDFFQKNLLRLLPLALCPIDTFPTKSKAI